jgi:hypothetical protein
VTVAAGVAIAFVAAIKAIVFNGVFHVADAMLQYSRQIKITWNC